MPANLPVSRTFYSYILGITSLLALDCKSPKQLATRTPEIIAVQNKELIPEGIEVHPESGAIYLSSLHQNKIVTVDKHGNCKDLISPGQNGFMRGLGIKVS